MRLRWIARRCCLRGYFGGVGRFLLARMRARLGLVTGWWMMRDRRTRSVGIEEWRGWRL